MIRLLIADDHAIVREGLKQFIALAPDIEVAAEACNGEEAQAHLRERIFDLVLLDMNMPGISGVDLIACLKSQWPDLPILVLSMHNEPHIAALALKAGASGYITKDSDPDRILLAIRKVAKGGLSVDAAIAERIAFGALKPEQRQPHQLLSDREFEIFLLLVRGKSVNEIAGLLSISKKTVSTHKLNLMEKMNISNIADLVRYALAHQLIA